MPWELENFTEQVASVLEGYPYLELPLLRSELRKHPGLDTVARQPAEALFPEAREPECAKAGLLLMLGGWEYSHETAQDVANPEGSYWHAIAHRVEPDYGNAGYWFRQVGTHPLFKPLAAGALEVIKASQLNWTALEAWDPFSFLEFCEQASKKRDQSIHRAAVAIQSLEWRLLFEYCAAASARA